MNRALIKTANRVRGRAAANIPPAPDPLAALQAQVDAQAAQITALQTQLAAKATAIPSVALFDTNIPYHSPMEPGDFDPIYNKMNEVITALQQ